MNSILQENMVKSARRMISSNAKEYISTLLLKYVSGELSSHAVVELEATLLSLEQLNIKEIRRI